VVIDTTIQKVENLYNLLFGDKAMEEPLTYAEAMQLWMDEYNKKSQDIADRQSANIQRRLDDLREVMRATYNVVDAAEEMQDKFKFRKGNFQDMVKFAQDFYNAANGKSSGAVPAGGIGGPQAVPTASVRESNDIPGAVNGETPMTLLTESSYKLGKILTEIVRLRTQPQPVFG